MSAIVRSLSALGLVAALVAACDGTPYDDVGTSGGHRVNDGDGDVGHGGDLDGSGGASVSTGSSSSNESTASVSGSGGGGPTTGSTTGGSGGGSAGSGSAGSGGSVEELTGCDRGDLDWKTAHKTWYTSHPDPGSEECIEYNGCTWAGMFAACDGKKSEAWVSARNIVAAFPDFGSLELHDLCLRKGDKTIIVTVLDTCADSDCSGCCTQNLGAEEQLIDLESFTNQRWGVPDGQIEWADLGPTQGAGCN